MSTNYQKLVADIKAYSGRTDTATISAIPIFIAAAQTKLDAVLRIPAMLKTINTPDAALSTPLEVMQIESLLLDYSAAEIRPYAEILAGRKMRHLSDYQRAIYAINGTSIELVTSADIVLTGYAKPPALSEQAPENAYTKGAENALMWYALSYLGVFARDTKAAQAWAALASTETETLNVAAEEYKSGTGVSGGAEYVRPSYF